MLKTKAARFTFRHAKEQARTFVCLNGRRVGEYFGISGQIQLGVNRSDSPDDWYWFSVPPIETARKAVTWLNENAPALVAMGLHYFEE